MVTLLTVSLVCYLKTHFKLGSHLWFFFVVAQIPGAGHIFCTWITIACVPPWDLSWNHVATVTKCSLSELVFPQLSTSHHHFQLPFILSHCISPSVEQSFSYIVLGSIKFGISSGQPSEPQQYIMPGDVKIHVFPVTPPLHDISQKHNKNLYRCSQISFFPYVLHASKLLVLLLECSSLLAVVLLVLPAPSSPQHTQSAAALAGSGTSHLWIELDLGYMREHQLNQSVLYLKCASLAHTADVFLHHQAVLLGFCIKGVKIFQVVSMCPLWC